MKWWLHNFFLLHTDVLQISWRSGRAYHQRHLHQHHRHFFKKKYFTTSLPSRSPSRMGKSPLDSLAKELFLLHQLQVVTLNVSKSSECCGLGMHPRALAQLFFNTNPLLRVSPLAALYSWLKRRQLERGKSVWRRNFKQDSECLATYHAFFVATIDRGRK